MLFYSEEKEEERNAIANDRKEEEELQATLQRSIEHQPLADDDPKLQVFVSYIELIYIYVYESSLSLT